MKVVALPIECIAWFNEHGSPTPLKFRILDENGNITIKINQVIHREKEKFAGNHMYVFDCRSEIDNEIKRYQLKYSLASCKWMLFKI